LFRKIKFITYFLYCKVFITLQKDGGGDSLVLRKEDCSEGSEVFDPFLGGDSELMVKINFKKVSSI
jgi:hypothetical protein